MSQVENKDAAIVREFARLRTAFVASVAGTATEDASIETLDSFYRIAGKFVSHEQAFNNRARLKSGAPSLLENLRGAEHAVVVREFAFAKEGLLSINEKIGSDIIRLVESNMGMKI